MKSIFSPNNPVRNSGFYAKGTFSIAALTIPPGDTTVVIATLSRTNFAHGHIDLAIPHSVSETTKRGMGGYIEVTRTDTEVWAEMDDLVATTIPGYPSGAPYTIWEYWQRYRAYGTGLGISAAQYHTSGSATRIKSAVIDGNQLKLTLTNTSGSVNAVVNLDGTYRVEGIV